MTRRNWIASVMLAGSILLAACGGAATEAPTKAPAQVATEVDSKKAEAPAATAETAATAAPTVAAEATKAPEAGSAEATKVPEATTAGAAASGIDLGFRPEVNGFSFPNYGNDTKPVNLTPADVRRMFGDDVCARIEGDNCTLAPTADQWMQQANSAMGGGHCEGFAVLTLLMYNGKVDPNQFGAATAAALTIDGNEKLQREIAYWFITQATQPAAAAIIKGTPAEIVAKLKEAYAQGKDSPDTYTIGIYKPDRSGGHAITAYGVQDKGNGIVWIMSYDNNSPKQERYVEVDTNANTWQYEASPNPSIATEIYKGDASTNTLEIVPSAPRLGKQVCQFCNKATGSKGGAAVAAPTQQFNQIWMEGKSRLLLTDDAGHKLGYEGDKFLSDIPSAFVNMIKGMDPLKEDASPVYNVPMGVKLTAVLDGNNLKAEHDPTDLAMIGPGYYIGVEGIYMDPGEKDTMIIAGDGKSLTYHTDYTETPDIILGVENPTADFELDVYGKDIASGSDTTVGFDREKGTVTVSTSATEPSSFSVAISRIDDKSTQTFNSESIQLGAKDKLTINYGAWAGNGKAMTAEIDRGGTGTKIEKVDMADTSN